jgi:hypothetical protein
MRLEPGGYTVRQLQPVMHDALPIQVATIALMRKRASCRAGPHHYLTGLRATCGKEHDRRKRTP